jgi:hypothetical protein
MSELGIGNVASNLSATCHCQPLVTRAHGRSSTKREAKSAGVARPPRRPERRPLTRAYWALLKKSY